MYYLWIDQSRLQFAHTDYRQVAIRILSFGNWIDLWSTHPWSCPGYVLFAFWHAGYPRLLLTNYTPFDKYS